MSRKHNIHLVAWYFRKPRPGVKTSQKGWMDNPDNVQWDEKVEIVRRLGNKDQTAHVILDLNDHKVIRNTFKSEGDFDEIFEYFFTNYSDYITRIMAQLDPTYLTGVVERLQKEIDQEEKHEEVPAQ